MKRKLFLVMLVLLLAVVSGGLFAQDFGGAKNFVSGDVGLITFGARYERLLTPKIGIGAVAYWNTLFIIFHEIEIGAFGRYYIWQGLFAELGLGFHFHMGSIKYSYEGNSGKTWGTRTGLSISPGVGYKFDPGKAGGFFVAPGITVPITLGKTGALWAGDPRKFGVSVGFIPYCSLGYAF